MKCLAFDGMTAWRVFNLKCFGPGEPETPAAEAPNEGER